jgi:hypothetical protein
MVRAITGAERDTVVASPSCWLPLAPQQARRPSVCTLHAWAWPRLTSRPVAPEQRPLEQLWPGAQARPQAPQCASEELVSTSQPLVALLSQLAREPVQAAMVHWPLVHAAVAPGSMQVIAASGESSTMPLQLLSMPSQSSAVGTTSPVQVCE